MRRVAEHFAARLRPLGPDTLDRHIQQAERASYDSDDTFAVLLSALPWLHPPTLEELRACWDTTYPGCVQPVPDLSSTFRALRALGIRLGVVTNGLGWAQNKKVDVLGVRPFAEIVIVSEAVGISKPDPRIFRLALAHLDVAPADAWFVGDDPVNDILGASSAGLTAVWIRDGKTWPKEHPIPHYQIDALAELIALLA